jgi:hypothetical protein
LAKYRSTLNLPLKQNQPRYQMMKTTESTIKSASPTYNHRSRNSTTPLTTPLNRDPHTPNTICQTQLQQQKLGKSIDLHPQLLIALSAPRRPSRSLAVTSAERTMNFSAHRETNNVLGRGNMPSSVRQLWRRSVRGERRLSECWKRRRGYNARNDGQRNSETA